MPTSRSYKAPGQEGMGVRRLMLFSGLFIVLSAAGVYVIYDQVAGRSFAFDSRLLSWQMVLGSVLLLLVYFATDGFRLHYILKALGHTLPKSCIFRLVFINIFFSNVTPLATGGGFAQIWYLRRQDVPLGTATAATTIRTMLAVVFIFSATPVFLLTLDAFDSARIGSELIMYLVLFVTLYLGFFAVLLFYTRWLLALVYKLLRGLCRLRVITPRRYRKWRVGSQQEMLNFSNGFRQYLSGSLVNVLLSVFFTLVFLLSLFSFPALLMWGLEYDTPYHAVIGLLAVTTFIMYFSPTPGASGIAEGVFGHLFTGLLTANHLVLVTVVWRFLTIYLGMLVGVLVTHSELTRASLKRA